MPEININTFLIEKLNNFKTFINNEFNTIINHNTHITIDLIDTFNKEIEFFIADIHMFICVVKAFDNKDTDTTIKMFFNKYGFNIDEFKNDIDYNKLKTYIDMFNDVIKNYIE